MASSVTHKRKSEDHEAVPSRSSVKRQFAVINMEDSGPVVASQYELVRRIMAGLSTAELKRCRLVCKLWQSASTAELKQPSRMTPALFFWRVAANAPNVNVSRRLRCRRQLEDEGSQYDSMDGEDSEDDMDLKSINQYKAVNPNVAKFEMMIPDLKEMHKTLNDYLKHEMMIDPALAIAFCVGDTSWYENVARSHTDPDRAPHGFFVDPPSLDSILPGGCNTFSVFAQGIINGNEELENHAKVLPSIGMLFLPKAQDVKIVPFEIIENQEEAKSLYGKGSGEEIYHKVMGDLISEKEMIKCAVVLSNCQENNYTFKFVKELLLKTSGNMALGGCLGDLVRSSSSKNKDKNIDELLQDYGKYYNDESNVHSRSVGFLFAVPVSKPNAMTAGSLILTPKIRGEAKVLQELKKLRNKVTNDSRSCAFMFACCGRGKMFHGKPNVEFRCFKKLFPEVPLVGIFGNGEIGREFLGESPENLGFSKKTLWHSYCTVFVVLTF